MTLNSVQPVNTLVFIVEDDKEIADLLALTLKRSGFAVRVFSSTESVLDVILDQRPAVLLLNDSIRTAASHSRSAPDGVQLLHQVVSAPSLKSLRKIMLSTRSTLRDRVNALDSGADDYITTPFATREVIARVRAVLRASATESASALQCGILLADLEARKMWLEDKPLDLTVTEFNMLTYLMRNAGHTISRSTLLAELWPVEKNVENGRVVDVYIHRLREKIEPDPSDPRSLITRRGQGYVLLRPGVIKSLQRGSETRDL